MAEPIFYIATMSLLLSLVIPACAIDRHQQQEEILAVVRDIQRANYFTFATLINMVQTSVPSNITFFMPDDRSLSKIIIPEHNVLKFLLRHSVPSLLPFTELSRLPNGTAMPTDQPDYMLKVSSNGRKELYLNNIKLTSPDICKSGPSFRCHGINGVFMPALPIPAPPKPSPPPPHHSPPHAKPPIPAPPPSPPRRPPPPPHPHHAPVPSPAHPGPSPTASISSSNMLPRARAWLCLLSLSILLVSIY
ncbi:hypothetical protein J5N97_024973 [Dioscorea zingiberensis]|uniref:FAS1 domain-containing protein n=1 Tax=Dioscorea zingiberensis TaxID=325984 RepID=A0A9D5H937_9LILI|nr:hypothetical protein J5N97_024973 [Dioscorea zingiberensis]